MEIGYLVIIVVQISSGFALKVLTIEKFPLSQQHNKIKVINLLVYGRCKIHNKLPDSEMVIFVGIQKYTNYHHLLG
jgi:hypothetical protein